MDTHALKLYDSLRRQVLPFEPYEDGTVRIYVCGMTVYDHAHVGHARAMVVFDALVRYLRHRGWKVEYARNFTDIDDKIIARAPEAPLAHAEKYIEAFREDMAALGLAPVQIEPRVSESIDSIQDLIARLIERGHAYASGGSVWFSVRSFPEYGRLSGQRLEKLRESPDTGEGKRDCRDFALWKAAAPPEPSWPSPWGPGRPGWHIECSAMSKTALSGPIDIHGGGLDLIFPHHENEIAQSQCGHGAQPYARYWMHNGLLNTSGGAKIARSEGNGATIREVLQRVPAEALRLYYLQAHYRSPLPWNEEALVCAAHKLARLYEALEAARTLRGPGGLAQVRDLSEVQEVWALAEGFGAQLRDALDHDFNTAAALGRAFELVRAFNRVRQRVKPKRLGGLAHVVHTSLSLLAPNLGLLAGAPHEYEQALKRMHLRSQRIDERYVQAQLRAREAARAARDFQAADAIRASLLDKRLEILDTPQGPRWKVAS